MIAFDNGPAGGDYVRYIDDLMKRASVAVETAGRAGGDVDRVAMERMRERVARRAAAQVGGAFARRPEASARPSTTSAGAASDTGFVDPASASTAAARAAAVASALMSGEIARRELSGHGAPLSLGAIVLGVALVVAGAAWPAASLAVILAGGALAAWGVRRLRSGRPHQV